MSKNTPYTVCELRRINWLVNYLTSWSPECDIYIICTFSRRQIIKNTQKTNLTAKAI